MHIFLTDIKSSNENKKYLDAFEGGMVTWTLATKEYVIHFPFQSHFSTITKHLTFDSNPKELQ